MSVLSWEEIKQRLGTGQQDTVDVIQSQVGRGVDSLTSRVPPTLRVCDPGIGGPNAGTAQFPESSLLGPELCEVSFKLKSLQPRGKAEGSTPLLPCSTDEERAQGARPLRVTPVALPSPR